MKRTTFNIVLAAILLGLGAAVYFSNGNRPQRRPPLTALNSASVRKIEVRRQHARTITLVRKDGDWNLTAPVNAAADPYRIKEILDIATTPCERLIKPTEIKLSDLGLAPPRYTLMFDKTRIDVGRIEPLKYRRYMKTGNRICLVRNPTTPALGSHYASLVSKHLVSPGQAIVSIDLPAFKVTRDTAGKGWSVKPAQPHAAQDSAQELAKAWASAQAEWNESAPAGSASSHRHPETVRLRLKAGRTLTFLVLKRTPQLVLERPDIGVRYVLSKDDASTLLKLRRRTAKHAANPAHATSAGGPAPPASH